MNTDPPALLARALGHTFTKPELARQALTHRSFGAAHSERLEFLGDAVLDCAISALLFERFRQIDEGNLSRQRAQLVCEETLVKLALQIKLGELLFLGEGELKSGGRSRPSILADALEAALGAIYLDAGFDAALKVITQLYAPLLQDIDPKNDAKDAKTALQEYLQAKRLPLPAYSVLATLGAAHAQQFAVECVIPKLRVHTQGRGDSRRAAEQAAARAALELLAPRP